MIKMFAFKSLDGSVGNLSPTREALEKIVEENPLFLSFTEIVEIDYNDAPITEVGEAIKQELMKRFSSNGRSLKHFHASWGEGYYALSADDRLKTLLDIFDQIDTAPTIKFNDSNCPKTDVKEFVKTL